MPSAGRLEDLLDFLGAPEAHRRLLRIPPSGPDVSLSRVDGFIASGQVRFIEINSDAPAGFGYADRMTEVFARLPLVQRMRTTDAMSVIGSVDALVAELRSHARVADPRVAIVDLRTVRTRPDQEILREEFERRGLATPSLRSARHGDREEAGSPRRTGDRSRLSAHRHLRGPRHRAGGRGVLRGLPRGSRGLRQLLPLLSLRGQGLLRDPHRRAFRRTHVRRTSAPSWPLTCPGRGRSRTGGPSGMARRSISFRGSRTHRAQLVLEALPRLRRRQCQRRDRRSTIGSGPRRSRSRSKPRAGSFRNAS